MTHSLRHIPIRTLGSSPAHLRYLEEDPDLEPFLGRRPRNVDDLLRRAPKDARRLVSPAQLAPALRRYAERHEAGEEVLASVDRVASGEAQLIVTGQQPGLFGGPLYTVHKVATAVRLAQEINAHAGRPLAIPLFWNHTDDHDLEEANRAYFVNNHHEVQRIRLSLERSGEALRDIGIGHKLEQGLAAVTDLLPHNEFRDQTLETFAARHPDEHFGDGLARLLFRLFGRFGLLVIEPRDLPREAFDVLPRWWSMAEQIQSTIRPTIEVLLELGLEITMDPGATLMFQTQGGRRTAMVEGDPVHHATDLSPGVLLRPLWQDACLPTIASVVGPGELAYLSVAGPLYRQLGVPAPVLVPRASLTLVEPSIAKLLKRFGWELTDLDVGPEKLFQDAVGDDSNATEETLEGLIQRLGSDLDQLATDLEQRDPQLLRALERTRDKAQEELGRLLAKLRNSRQNREGTGLRQIRRLANTLRPRGRPQERVLTVVPFMAAHGPQLGDVLVAAADPFTSSHGILEL
ncbi:MAG: bacillithiol biosynthesis BshC [Planctomycetes bacterium]|nr:bacillithiol biosynthesis BshC [Planctomycetota bacterium]MCB9870269.1 bacillithiol biosynthesis BshC [Planctomycetota bacterium]MCB9888151.1 bacillithiol biosynthesis BshC [Planctomycetota bacterium]